MILLQILLGATFLSLCITVLYGTGFAANSILKKMNRNPANFEFSRLPHALMGANVLAITIGIIILCRVIGQALIGVYK
jgi:hypothetical protein